MAGPCTSRVSTRVCVLRASTYSVRSPAQNLPTPPEFSLSLSAPAQKYLNCPIVANATLNFSPSSETNNRKRRGFRAHAFIEPMLLLAGTVSLRVRVSARSILLLLRQGSSHSGRSTTTAMAINETDTEPSRAWLSDI
ncbi:hypothetical protein QR685DRAFT_571982 [Neurospora intermedia]|uniref:Uncharacterized protein n=1 Tax=Neurospora intermedia TaxID=5142 RepID=A0ABR3DE32_NEUIN